MQYICMFLLLSYSLFFILLSALHKCMYGNLIFSVEEKIILACLNMG